MPFVLALFTHRLFRLFLAFAGYWSLSSRPTPHAPRLTVVGVRRRCRAELGTAFPTQQASTCYDMLRFPVLAEI